MDRTESIRQLKEQRSRVSSWGSIVLERLRFVEKYAGNTVLDVGCSTGSYVYYLIDKGYKAYGCDILLHKEWKGNLRKHFKIGDIVDLPYEDNSFETVIAFEVLEHIEYIDDALEGLGKISKKNIIISVPNCLQPEVFKASGLAFHHWTDRTHKQFFTKELLVQALKRNGFKILEFKLINPVIPELLVLSSFRIPTKFSYYVAKFVSHLPFRKKYYMSLMVAASK